MLLFQHFVCRVFAIMRSAPYSLARDWIPDSRFWNRGTRRWIPASGTPHPVVMQ